MTRLTQSKAKTAAPATSDHSLEIERQSREAQNPACGITDTPVRNGAEGTAAGLAQQWSITAYPFQDAERAGGACPKARAVGKWFVRGGNAVRDIPRNVEALRKSSFLRIDMNISLVGMAMIEGVRDLANQAVFRMGTFAKCWPTWRQAIADLTDDVSNPDKIYGLGSHLRHVFRLTREGGREQSNLSGGGAAWEGLVCWYLNLVLTDTRAVVVKQSKGIMPEPLYDAMAVMYNTIRTNSESDLSGIIFPDRSDILSLNYDKAKLDKIVSENIGLFSLHNIQCKTNWNDNAQIPMLWDMIYRFSGVKQRNVRIGNNGFDLNDLANFTYSFVTAPSQTKDIKPNSMPVRRVDALSGGNFWGKPSQSGVAQSLSEIFKQVFGRAFDRDIRSHIAQLVENGRISLDGGLTK